MPKKKTRLKSEPKKSAAKARANAAKSSGKAKTKKRGSVVVKSVKATMIRSKGKTLQLETREVHEFADLAKRKPRINGATIEELSNGKLPVERGTDDGGYGLRQEEDE